ncbi:hypothetical protein BDD43_3225 [Mucilaginibacter gracilis]|uniref:Nuclear transport factor 2 family protein n=1 Tax=Mucilaginibacter gracilis TaxID=423350 RepID=A0A495J233_9SPHI|nr:hypothetical protein [Mucilaginibacter gracilis]RKR83025.1 hypothetical protein BDD43_3225 [Mucilaginibacter gracilis]
MKFITSIILLFITGLTFAQSKPYKATAAQTAALKKQAEACADAMMKQNFKQLAVYTYPPLIKAMGGADKMATKLTATAAQMQSQGIAFKSITIGDVKDIVKSKNDLYSIVQDILQISMNGTLITSSSYLLAYSSNNGLRWYFVDTVPLKNQNIKKLFPTYPDGLVIPDMHKPIAN